MAAPANKTIVDLSGKWTLNKTLSDPTDPALALQGIGWILRKGIGAATVTLSITHYVDESSTTHIDIEQSASGLSGTTERRTLDWTAREHKDWIFGRADGRSKYVTLSELAEMVKEGGEARSEGWCEDEFLAQDWIEEEGGKVVLNNVKGDAGWIATQVWGFQEVGGERRYVRNVVIAKGGKFEALKMIYDYVE